MYILFGKNEKKFKKAKPAFIKHCLNIKSSLVSNQNIESTNDTSIQGNRQAYSIFFHKVQTGKNTQDNT